MKTVIEASAALELRIVGGPCTIQFQRRPLEIQSGDDLACLVLITRSATTILSEEIVAIATDRVAFMRLRAFVIADGGITLHRDIGP